MMTPLEGWPKTRAPLPPEYQRVYEAHMAINRGGGSALNRAALWLEEWMHRSVASPPANAVLELGAGSLNHVRFEPQATTYDVVEPLREVVEQSLPNTPHAIGYIGDYGALLQKSTESRSVYDKVVSVAVLEHLDCLPVAIASSALLLKPSGVFAAGIPSEGGRLWKWSWQATTGRAFKRRFGLDYSVLMEYEHINSAHEIESVLRHLFTDVSIRRFPGPSLETSIYTTLHARNPRVDRAEAIAQV